MTIVKQLLISNITDLKENPHATDKMNLAKESCIIKGKGNKQIVMKKGEKLLRMIRQLLEMNCRRIKLKVGFSAVGRHIDCLVMTRS